MGGTHGKVRERTMVPARTAVEAPQLRAIDFQRHLHRKADEIAPTDVRALVAQQDDIRRRIAVDAEGRPTFRQQVEMALDLLGHHVADEIPHVPFRTIALLTAALFYYLEPVDVIPDIVPGIGTVDDRLFMAFAFYEGADGIARYRAWLEVRAEDATIEVQARAPAKDPGRPGARAAR
jgi:uncharacterized membrane protein YkvA (DUF1232 family)